MNPTRHFFLFLWTILAWLTAPDLIGDSTTEKNSTTVFAQHFPGDEGRLKGRKLSLGRTEIISRTSALRPHQFYGTAPSVPSPDPIITCCLLGEHQGFVIESAVSEHGAQIITKLWTQVLEEMEVLPKNWFEAAFMTGKLCCSVSANVCLMFASGKVLAGRN